MQHDFNEIVSTAMASLSGSPTSSEVEAAAIRLIGQRENPHGRVAPVLQAVGCSISVAACTSRRSATQRARVYDHVRRSTHQVLSGMHQVAQASGMSTLPHLEISIREATGLWAGHEVDEYLSVSDAIHQAVQDAGGHKATGPFLDLSLPEYFGHIDALPEILKQFKHLRPLIQIGTDQDPPSDDVLEALSLVLAIHRVSAPEHDSTLALVVNGCDRRAFGRRAACDVLGLSMAVSDMKDAEFALGFGEAIAQTMPEAVQLVHLEHRLSSMRLDTSIATASSTYQSVRVSSCLDGFPFYAPNQNRVSFPDVFTAEEMAAFMSSRLTPFAQTGKEAGLVLDLKRGL